MRSFPGTCFPSVSLFHFQFWQPCFLFLDLKKWHKPVFEGFFFSCARPDDFKLIYIPFFPSPKGKKKNFFLPYWCSVTKNGFQNSLWFLSLNWYIFASFGFSFLPFVLKFSCICGAGVGVYWVYGCQRLFVDSTVSFHLYVGSGSQTQACAASLYPLSHLASPPFLIDGWMDGWMVR